MFWGKDKVAIFGDSYADMMDYEERNINELAWTRLLNTNHNFFTYNFARGGSSIFWSYKKFLAHKDSADIIIFVITQESRLNMGTNEFFAPNLISIQNKLANLDKDDPIYNKLVAADMYYKYLNDDEFSKFIRDCIVKSVVDICEAENKKLILIPGFTIDGMLKKYVKHFKSVMFEITEQEISTQFDGIDRYYAEKTTRACHMSKQNNIILANFIASIIRGEERYIGIHDFVYTKVKDPENYWEIT